MKLSEAQIERLDLLIEECAEVIKEASKSKRFGYSSKHPLFMDGMTNKQCLELELGGLAAIVTLLVDGGDIDAETCEWSQRAKIAEIKEGKYTKHQ